MTRSAAEWESLVHAAFSEGFGCGMAERDRMAAPWPADPSPLDETAYWLHSEASALIASRSGPPSPEQDQATGEKRGEQLHNRGGGE